MKSFILGQSSNPSFFLSDGDFMVNCRYSQKLALELKKHFIPKKKKLLLINNIN